MSGWLTLIDATKREVLLTSWSMFEPIRPPWLVKIWTIVLVTLCGPWECGFVMFCPCFSRCGCFKIAPYCMPLYIIHQFLAVPHLAIPRGPFGPANTHSCLQDTAQDLVIDGKWKEPTIRRLQETLEKLCLSMLRQEFSFMYRETSSIKRGSSTEEVYELIEHIWTSLVWKPSTLGIH